MLCQGPSVAVGRSTATSHDVYADRYNREMSRAAANFHHDSLSGELNDVGRTDEPRPHARLMSHSHVSSQPTQRWMFPSFDHGGHSAGPPGYF